MNYLSITLLRSPIGTDARQRATLRGLGLRKIGGTRQVENTPSVRGMVKTVLHLVKVEEVSGG